MDKITSQHFIVSFYKNSTASKDMAKILEILESSYFKIISDLDLSIKHPKIRCHLFETEGQKIKETGENGYAEAYPEKYYMNCVYNLKIKALGAHEIVHILINSLGKPNFVISEGVAESFEDYWAGLLNNKIQRLPHDQWVRTFIKGKTFIPITELFDDSKFWDYDSAISYPECGSFLKFLRQELSLKQIKSLIGSIRRNADNPLNLSKFNAITGKSLSDFEDLWLDKIGKK